MFEQIMNNKFRAFKYRPTVTLEDSLNKLYHIIQKCRLQLTIFHTFLCETLYYHFLNSVDMSGSENG